LNGDSKNRLKKAYIGALICSLGLIGTISFLTASDNEIAVNVRNQIPFTQNNTQKKSTIPFMEDNSDTAKEIITLEKKEKKEKSLTLLNESVNKPTIAEKPNLLFANNQYFYLFDENILMPISNKEWKEYNISGDANNSYSSINEYYLLDESPDKWTQKVTIHKINVADKNCFNFADKLINGLIVNISDQVTSNGHEFKNENIDFNYVRKQSNDTAMYWEHVNIPDTQDEVQFVRIFISEYSHNMYLVTYTLKNSLNATPNDTIINSLKVLDSVQELKRK